MDGLCVRIRKAEQALMLHHESVLRTYGLTMAQYTALLFLSQEGSLSGAQLARACGVTQQTMTGVLQSLKTKDLIDRRQSAAHAKVLLAHLTPKGRKLLGRAYAEVDALEQAIQDAFSTEEYDELCRLLGRATTVLSEQARR
jgi:DNA-binding MarR family transcriptional regulator